MGLTDFLISFSIIMMMLSFVSERTSNFIKLYFQSKIIYIPFIYIDKNGKWNVFLSAKLEILAYSQPTQAAEKEREYRVMIINIIIGIIIAALANANFFEIIKKISSKTSNNDVILIQGWLMSDIDLPKVLGFFYLLTFLWSLSLMLFNKLQENATGVNQYYVRAPFLLWIIFTVVLLILGHGDQKSNYYIIINHTIGYAMVGVFLSLGSKFWHDLLDILFKFKNTQQKLADNKTYTDYDSADKLAALAETFQYEVAEQLFQTYKNEISKIEGVVSYGFNTVMDKRSRLYRKIIEVEYSTAEAQKPLLELQNCSSIMLNYNTFYLKDYLNLYYTNTLEAVNAVDDSPQCYAHNDYDGNDHNRGSFNVAIIDQKYYAISNLHVFADKAEFKDYYENKNYVLTHTDVKFVINGETFYGSIDLDRIDFGFKNDESQDFAACEIGADLYNAYTNFIKGHINLSNLPIGKMEMFGAASKHQQFNMISTFLATDCKVNYNTFYRQMKLIKIDDIKVIKGDSGSFVYYKQKINSTTTIIQKGIIVAKSDNFSYMFRYIDI
ncbi:MAG: hypothetical protein QM710_03855 [Flavobacterium sp.]